MNKITLLCTSCRSSNLSKVNDTVTCNNCNKTMSYKKLFDDTEKAVMKTVKSDFEKSMKKALGKSKNWTFK